MLTTLLSHTPTYVFAILAALVMIGLKQTQTRQLSIQRVAILPLVFMAWGISSLTQLVSDTGVALAAYLVATAVAGVLGFSLSAPTARRLDASTLEVGGSWIPLMVMVAIFVTRFILIAASHIHADLTNDAIFALAAGAGFGFWSGLLSTRAIRILLAARVFGHVGGVVQG